MLVQNFGGTKKNIMEVLKKAYCQKVTTFTNFASAYACVVTRLRFCRKLALHDINDTETHNRAGQHHRYSL